MPSSSGILAHFVTQHALQALILIVRHDWGGYVAIAAANMHPSVVRRIAVLCVPHMRAFMLLPLMQLLRSWYRSLSVNFCQICMIAYLCPLQVCLCFSNSIPPTSASFNLQLCIHRLSLPLLEYRRNIFRVSLTLTPPPPLCTSPSKFVHNQTDFFFIFCAAPTCCT